MKNVLTIAAIAAGTFLVVRSFKKKKAPVAKKPTEPILAEAETEEEGESSVSNASGTTTATACKMSSYGGSTCQGVCESIGGTYDPSVGQFGGCLGGNSVLPAPFGDGRKPLRSRSMSSADGWESNEISEGIA